MNYLNCLNIKQIKFTKTQLSTQSGFTMVELIVVLSTLSSLMAIAIPSYLGYVHKAQNLQATVNLQGMKKNVLNAYLENGKYPADVTANKIPLEVSGKWHIGETMPFKGGTDYEHWSVGNGKCVVMIGWFGKDGQRDYPIHQMPPPDLSKTSDDQIVTVAKYDCPDTPHGPV